MTIFKTLVSCQIELPPILSNITHGNISDVTIAVLFVHTEVSLFDPNSREPVPGVVPKTYSIKVRYTCVLCAFVFSYLRKYMYGRNIHMHAHTHTLGLGDNQILPLSR